MYYCHTDPLGTIKALSDINGEVVKTFEHEPFGKESMVTGELDEESRFTGKSLDSTGFYYFNARYYDPTLGRFISADPAKQGLNWYVYCNNNPLSFIDPTGRYGLSPSPECIQFIICYEKCREFIYDANPPKKDMTIGIGHKLYTVEEFEKYKNGISLEDAVKLFESDLNSAINTSLVPFLEENEIDLKQHEFDALVCFTYNMGPYIWDRDAYNKNPKKAFDLKRALLEKADPNVLKKYWNQYIRQDGKVVKGLINRRRDKWEMFIDGDYNRNYSKSRGSCYSFLLINVRLLK